MAYDRTVSASGGTAPYGYAVTSGSLPPGLLLNAMTGQISGTPLTPGDFPFTITAADQMACLGHQDYDIKICPTITLSPTTLPSGVVGLAYNQSISGNGGAAPYTFAVTSGAVPDGLTLSQSGALSGTPTTPGTFVFTVTATDANGCSGSQGYSIKIDPPPCNTITISPASLPSATVGTPYNQTLTASGGTAPYSFAVTSGSLPSGLTLSSTGALTGTPNASGSFNFGITATDSNNCTGSKSYSITVSCPTIAIAPATLPSATAGTPYSQTITASGGTGPYTFTSSGALPPGLTLSGAGVLSGTPTTPGTYNFVVTATDADGCAGNRGYSLAVSCPTITLAPSSLPPGTVGTAYNQTITASGGTGPYAFSTSGPLPPGLTLSASGSLSGTPTTPGTYNFVVTATDANNCTANRPYSISVSAAPCPTIAVAPSSLSPGTVGVAYSQTITASGGAGPYSFAVSSGTLPPGLTLAPNGILSGTPTSAGSYNFVVTATDTNNCTGNQGYTLTISAAPCPTITLSPSSLPAGTAGSPYNQTLTASGGTGPYSFVILSGSLPPGLTLSASGALTGTPTASGSFGFTVAATDTKGCTGTRGYAIAVSCPLITISPTVLPTATLGTFYSVDLVAARGTGPYSFIVTDGAPPSGISLSGTGGLSGTPRSAEHAVFTVTAIDAYGCRGSTRLTLDVVSATPQITALDPGSAAPGGPAFTLTVTGSGFVAGSVVNWNGSPRPTTFVSSTQLTASIAAADIASPGSATITVVNPGSVTSNAVVFPISSTCAAPGPPVNPTIVPSNNPGGPVTGIDFLLLSWGPPATGTAATGYEFAINGDPFTSAGTATSVVVPPRGNNDPIQLHVRAVGCTPAVPGAVADSPVYSPVPPHAAFAASGPVSPGAMVTFTDTSDPQATSWLWLFGDGQIATTQSTTHSFSSAGTYSVVLIASNGAGSSIAMATQTVQSAQVSAARPETSRALTADSDGRARAERVLLRGLDRTWLSVRPRVDDEDTILYLRLYDTAGALLLERRLSVAASQPALYDVGAWGVRGAVTVEVVCARPVDVWLIETVPEREPRPRIR